MKCFVILLLLTLSISSLSFAYGGVSTDRTAYPIQDIDPLELWSMNDVIMDGTVIDKESLSDENGKEIFGYNIKVNEYFKGKQNAKIIYAKQMHAFPNFHLEKDDNALFYIRNTSEFGYVIQPHSVKTFGDCDARNLIEISQLPNGEYFRSSPTRSESYFDPCIADYFSYDPDFFKGIVNGITPLKQMSFGIPIEKVLCFDNLVLIQKHDGTPACVTPESAIALYERGWTLTLHIAVTRDAPSVYIGPADIPSASNQFALNFYSHVTQDKESNVFFSPTSIFTAFAIAYEGAKDNTATEMENVFGFESDESKRRIGFADMQKQLNMKQQNNTISLANALWIAENFEVLPEYADTAKAYYDSEVEPVSFASKEKGVDLINSWVDEKTHGKIKKIFEELDPATELVITNAIYFKGIWEDPFDKTKTTVGDFHVTSDATVQVPMMQSKTSFPNVAVNDLVQIVELPYEGENFSMLVLLPRDVDGMESLEESLSADSLDKWKEEMNTMKTKVYMPKFKLETEYDLKSVLQEMGIHDAFANADFTGISNSGLYIEKATHKAFVEVNEEGTEAAAATGMSMTVSGPFDFTVDRPFIFIIQDNETGQILFMGKIMDPQIRK